MPTHRHDASEGIASQAAIIPRSAIIVAVHHFQSIRPAAFSQMPDPSPYECNANRKFVKIIRGRYDCVL